MKKDYSSLFNHYDGLSIVHNTIDDMIKVHRLMEKAGIGVTSSTDEKLIAYSDRRPFKVHYFISKQGKNLKWCPTASEEKHSKMNLKPASWWIDKLSDATVVSSNIVIPNDWLLKQVDNVRTMTFSKNVNSIVKEPAITDDLVTEGFIDSEEPFVEDVETEELPF